MDEKMCVPAWAFAFVPCGGNAKFHCVFLLEFGRQTQMYVWCTKKLRLRLLYEAERRIAFSAARRKSLVLL